MHKAGTLVRREDRKSKIEFHPRGYRLRFSNLKMASKSLMRLLLSGCTFGSYTELCDDGCLYKRTNRDGGLVIGEIVGLDIFFLAFISGASMNPARSF